MTTDSAMVPRAGTADPRRWWILVIVSFAQFVLAIDGSIVNVMGPRLKEAIGLSTTGLQWVMNIYVLLFGGLLLLGGRLADVIGRKQIFLIGLLVFTAASFAAGLSHTEAELLAARAVQGLAAAALSPASLSIVVTVFPDPDERKKAFGVWGTIIGVGASMGTLLGGAIADADWRWAFWLNVPIGVIVAAGTFAWVHIPRPSGKRPSTDLLGALTATGGLLLLVYGIINSSIHSWTAPATVASFASSAVLLVAFVFVEARSKAPLVPLRLFRSRAVLAGGFGEFLTAALMMPLFFMLPLYMQEVQGYSPLKTGLAWLPTSIGIMVFASFAPKLIMKTGPRTMYLAGTGVLVAVVALAIGIPLHGGYARFMLPLSALFGLGLVLCLIPTPIVGTSQATEQDAGTTSALLNASTQIGAGFGIAVSVTVLNSRVSHLLEAGQPYQTALVHGLSRAFIVLAVFLGLSMLNGFFTFRGLGGASEQGAANPGQAEGAVAAAADPALEIG
ncbi:MAG TPA: MFS transporter [Actinocrinis sp.]|uniref:MFS transporter n=1 Tax=Actinocrinis sp. TaxID=1920516 RepID=UPI002D3ABE34|nr:MFS transporter [Actinocrinis sp.]HZU54849.1 MFS transporter [Actinocrinis sp.]